MVPTYLKDKEREIVNAGSYLKDCFIKRREDEKFPLFVETADGVVIARLKGYAIVPLEEWNALNEKS